MSAVLTALAISIRVRRRAAGLVTGTGTSAESAAGRHVKSSAHAASHAEFAHERNVDVRAVDQRGRISFLRRVGRGDNTCDLAINTLGSANDQFVQDLCCDLIFFSGVERCRVFSNERVDLTSDTVVNLIKSASFDVFVSELLQVCVIAGEIVFVFEEGVEEMCARERRVDRVVDDTRSVTCGAHRESAEGEIVIPREDVELTVVFVEIVVVRH